MFILSKFFSYKNVHFSHRLEFDIAALLLDVDACYTLFFSSFQYLSNSTSNLNHPFTIQAQRAAKVVRIHLIWKGGTAKVLENRQKCKNKNISDQWFMLYHFNGLRLCFFSWIAFTHTRNLPYKNVHFGNIFFI